MSLFRCRLCYPEDGMYDDDSALENEAMITHLRIKHDVGVKDFVASTALLKRNGRGKNVTQEKREPQVPGQLMNEEWA